jgi:hypothetical protein
VVHRLLAILLLMMGCVRGVKPASPASLVGLSVPLVTSPSLRLALAGRLDGSPIVVHLDPGLELSLVTRGCRGVEPLPSRVTLADPFGPQRTFQLARIEGLDLGSGLLQGFDAALIADEGCVVILGGDVLGGLALEVHPAARELRFHRSAPREAWLALLPPGDEVEVVTVTREPRHDWPLVAVRISQGTAIFTGVLLFSAREARTRLYEVAAREAGLKPGLELLEGLPVPEGLALPKALSALRGFAVDRIELSVGVGVADVPVELEAGASPSLAQGVLGADVWGRFDAIIDLTQGLVVLHRPRVLTSGSRAQCERDGRLGEDVCFEITQRHQPGGIVVGMATWRALPEGGRVSFDFGGVDPSCRVGFTFPPTDRGRSTLHELPWGRLGEVMPACAAALATATRVEPGLFQDGPLEECPGVCAYAQDISTARTTCECQPTRGNLDEDAERELLQLYRKLLEQARPAAQEEPSDPN